MMQVTFFIESESISWGFDQSELGVKHSMEKSEMRETLVNKTWMVDFFFLNSVTRWDWSNYQIVFHLRYSINSNQHVLGTELFPPLDAI